MGIVTGYLAQLVNNGIKLLNGGTAVSSSNPLPTTQPDGLAVSGTATSAEVLFTTSMLNYESITVQVTSAGTGCTIVYEQSEDQSIWYAAAGVPASNTGTSALITTTSTVAMTQFARRGLYFRARVNAYTSGAVTVTGTMSKVPVTHTVEARLAGFAFEGSTSTGTPIPTGLECRTSNKTLVTNGQIVRSIATTDGRQITRLNSIPENEWRYAAASGGIVNTADNVLIAAAGANIKNYLTGISLANPSAVATEVVIKDGSSVVWRTYLAANAPLQSIHFATPIVSSANAALNVACITTGTQTYVNAGGYRAP